MHPIPIKALIIAGGTIGGGGVGIYYSYVGISNLIGKESDKSSENNIQVTPPGQKNTPQTSPAPGTESGSEQSQPGSTSVQIKVSQGTGAGQQDESGGSSSVNSGEGKVNGNNSPQNTEVTTQNTQESKQATKSTAQNNDGQPQQEQTSDTSEGDN